MAQPEGQKLEAQEKAGGLQLRNELRREALTRLNDVVHGVDSRNFEHASIAVGAFLARTLDAADVLHDELNRDQALPVNDTNKLPQNVRRFYEDFITEAESVAIILPALVQQARLVQHTPNIQARLNQLYEMIVVRDGFLNQVEVARAGLLKAQGARIQGRPIQFDQQQLARIITIADQAWRIRQQLVIPVDLQALEKQLVADEASVKALTQSVGSASRTTAATADHLRRTLGATRVTQGMPSAEVILDNPSQSIQTWHRLLTQGGPNERRRYARQLREAVFQFREDFIQMRLYEQFEKNARERMEKYIKANEPGMADKIAAWCGTLGMDVLAARLRNDPNSFREIFEQVTKEMRTQFESIRKRDNGGLEQFIKLLEGVEKGGNLDQKTFEERLTAYADVQEHSISTLSVVQRWMVAENVGVIGNPVDGRANMLEQVTRVGDQTLVGFLRNQSPYGMFRPQSYYDPRTNRLTLVTPVQGPNGFLEHVTHHGLNVGRGAAYSAGTALVIYGLMTKMPYLRAVAPLRHIVIPVVLAELSIAGAQQLAKQEQARIATENITKVVTLLQGPPPLNARDAATASNALFASMVVLLHVSHPGSSPDSPDRILAIEAHIYTNQLMVALGYPPHHRLGATVIPPGINDIPADRRSPELMQFLQVHYSDIESDRKRTQEQREEKNKLHVHVQESLKKLGVNVTVEREDRVTQILRGQIPGVVRVDDLMAAARSPEFEAQRKKILARFGAEGTEEQRLAIYRLVGGIYWTMKRLRKIHDTYKNDTLGLQPNQQDPATRRQIILKRNRTYSLDGNNFTYAQVEEDLRRYVFQTPLPDILAAVRFFEVPANQPDDDQLALHWHGTTIGWVRKFAVEYLQARHGAPGQRSSLGQDALREWEQAVEYARTHLREGEAQMRRKNIEANPIANAPAEGVLAGDLRAFTDNFLVGFLGPEALKQEQALAPEIAEVRKLASALSQQRETVLKDPLRGWGYEEYSGGLAQYTKRLGALQKSVAAHAKPIEELRSLTREAVTAADTQIQLESVQHDELAQALFATMQPRPSVFTRGMRADEGARGKVFHEQDRVVIEEMARLPSYCRDDSTFALSNFMGVEFVRNQQGQQESYVATFVYRRSTDRQQPGFRYIQQVFTRNLEADGTPASFISQRGMPIVSNTLSHLPADRQEVLGQAILKSTEARRAQEIGKRIGRGGRLYCLAATLPDNQAGILESEGNSMVITVRSGNMLTLLFVAADGTMTYSQGELGQKDQKQIAASTKEWAQRALGAITAPNTPGMPFFELSDMQLKVAAQLEKSAFGALRNADLTGINAILQATASPITTEDYLRRMVAGTPGIAQEMRQELQEQLLHLFQTRVRTNTLFNQQAFRSLVSRVLGPERAMRNLPETLTNPGEVSQAVFQIEQAMSGQ